MPIVDINFFSDVVSWTSNLAALIIACLYCYRPDRPAYLKVFPLYLFVSFWIEFFADKFLRPFLPFTIHDENSHIADVLYNLFTLFETAVFSYFLYQVIRSPFMKKFTVLLLALFLIYFTSASFLHGLYYHNYKAVALESIVILIPCLIFFRELFTRHEPLNLLKDPSFWMITGIFFYLATIFPLFMTLPWLRSHGLNNVAHGLYSINDFAVSVTYFLFIKGFTCRIKK
jgi:hypothetical protein